MKDVFKRLLYARVCVCTVLSVLFHNDDDDDDDGNTIIMLEFGCLLLKLTFVVLCRQASVYVRLCVYVWAIGTNRREEKDFKRFLDIIYVVEQSIYTWKCQIMFEKTGTDRHIHTDIYELTRTPRYPKLAIRFSRKKNVQSENGSGIKFSSIDSVSYV